MKNTDYTLDSLSSIITLEDNLGAILGIISDMDLEIREIRTV